MSQENSVKIAFFENFFPYDRLVMEYLSNENIEAEYRPNLDEDFNAKKTDYSGFITDMHSDIRVRDHAGLERARKLEVFGLPIIVFTSESVDKESEKNWRATYQLGEKVVFISKDNIQLKQFAQMVRALTTQRG